MSMRNERKAGFVHSLGCSWRHWRCLWPTEPQETRAPTRPTMDELSAASRGFDWEELDEAVQFVFSNSVFTKEEFDAAVAQAGSVGQLPEVALLAAANLLFRVDKGLAEGGAPAAAAASADGSAPATHGGPAEEP